MMFRQFICAVEFLTIIPLTKGHPRNDKELSRSMIFYPVVGLLIGLLSLIVYRAASNFFVPAVSMILALLFMIGLTGGLHIDGFADMCDGFYAGEKKEEILMIMKDSHIGTIAVLGIVSLILLKIVLLFSLLLKERVEIGFLLVPSVSRWIMALLASWYPYARLEEGLAGPFVKNAGLNESLLSSLLLLVIAYLLSGVNGILVSVGTLIVALIFMQWIRKKIGGVTGDVLGGLSEISEVAALFLLQFS